MLVGQRRWVGGRTRWLRARSREFPVDRTAPTAIAQLREMPRSGVGMTPWRRGTHATEQEGLVGAPQVSTLLIDPMGDCAAPVQCGHPRA